VPFLRERLPTALERKVRKRLRLRRDDGAGWHATLAQRGWLATHWPREWGGPGWGPVQRFIFENGYALVGAPRIVPLGGNRFGPVLIRYGTEAQKRHWLPRILDGSDRWCQGDSEPGGSDLASLKTRAVRDRDHYIVNGQRTWTTLGHYANRMFALVRTDPEAKPQEGISFLLIDLDSPGVQARPIITLGGEHEVNEVFFTDVRLPLDRLVGAENQGLTIAKYLLTDERTNSASVGLPVAALLSEAAGGLGGGGFDIASVFECAGRALVVEPLRGALVVVQMLAQADDPPAVQQTLASVLDGAVVALAYGEPQARHDPWHVATVAQHHPSGWGLSGHKAVVPQGAQAAGWLVSARLGGAGGDAAQQRHGHRGVGCCRRVWVAPCATATVWLCSGSPARDTRGGGCRCGLFRGWMAARRPTSCWMPPLCRQRRWQHCGHRRRHGPCRRLHRHAVRTTGRNRARRCRIKRTCGAPMTAHALRPQPRGRAAGSGPGVGSPEVACCACRLG